MYYNIQKGQDGENWVAQCLEKRGYIIIARNYRKTFGEVDIIAQKGNIVAFVEVKFRRNPLIDPTEIITFTKQKSIIKIAKHFLSSHTNADDEITCRFDVALVEENNNGLHLRYIPNAFTTYD